MEKASIAAMVLMLCTMAQADTIRLEVFSKYVIKSCDSYHSSEWTKYVLSSRCGPPRDVLVELPPHESHLQITPSAVFVKKCVGVCPASKRCVATKQREKMIPVRYHDVSTRKDWCAHYPVTEDVACACERLPTL